MKIEFIKPTYTFSSGEAVVALREIRPDLDNFDIMGFCHCKQKGYARKITVVMQSERYETFKILCHELIHVVIDLFFLKRRDRLHDIFDNWSLAKRSN
uniref:Uncharacterized protein n=1 Tax=viral metagenome TaxID=1070528 RepID=A0A6H1ZH87_9ZZZZ